MSGARWATSSIHSAWMHRTPATLALLEPAIAVLPLLLPGLCAGPATKQMVRRVAARLARIRHRFRLSTPFLAWGHHPGEECREGGATVLKKWCKLDYVDYKVRIVT